MLKTRGFEGYCIMEFSKRLDLFGDEIFAALNERKVALEAQGRTIYNPVSYTHLTPVRSWLVHM